MPIKKEVAPRITAHHVKRRSRQSSSVRRTWSSSPLHAVAPRPVSVKPRMIAIDAAPSRCLPKGLKGKRPFRSGVTKRTRSCNGRSFIAGLLGPEFTERFGTLITRVPPGMRYVGAPNRKYKRQNHDRLDKL